MSSGELGRGQVGEENVRTVRTLFEQFFRREYELAFQIYDDEIVWDARALPMPELQHVFHGHDGVREFWRSWLEAWERIDVLEGPHHRAHGNQVVFWWRQLNRGEASGIGVEQDTAQVWTFENGRVVRVAMFTSHEEALRAAGLEP